jgi:hypothetical protein
MIEAARRQIPLAMKQVKFTGTLKIVDGVGLIREIDPTLPAYVGTPSPEMDTAWKEIIHRTSFVTLSHILRKEPTVMYSVERFRNGRRVRRGQRRHNTRP